MSGKVSFAWMSNPQYLAQVGHFLGGVALIVVAALFSIARCAGWTPTLVTLGVGVAAATFKEFVFDVAPWGEGDSWSDSLMDWSFYVLGGAVGTGLAGYAYHLAQNGACAAGLTQ
jgi:hypothetical protein